MLTVKKAEPAVDFDAANHMLAMDQLKKIMLLSAGAGIAARGATGLVHMLHRNMQEPEPSAVNANVLPFPIPARRQPGEKVAEGEGLADLTAPYRNTWYAMPMHAAGGIAAFGGGYKLLDWLMDQQRHKTMKSEVESAKKDFESALGTQPIGSHAKLADDKGTRVSQQLDEIYDLVMEKQARIAPALGGMAATLASVLALGSGYIGYNYAKNTSDAHRLEAAEKERQRRRQSVTAPFFVPQPS